MNFFNSSVLATIILSGTLAHAKTSLQIPVFVDGFLKNKIVSMKTVNRKLKREHKAPLQESIEIVKGVAFDYWKFSGAIDKALTDAGIKDGSMGFESVPGEYNRNRSITCFTGNGGEVGDFVAGLADGPYSEQLNIHGWKYRSERYVSDENDGVPGATEKLLREESKEWRDYRADSDVVLILSAVGDDGTDVNVSEIPRCK